MEEPDDQNHVERVAIFDRYEILDSEPEVAFDRIARLASEVFDVPVSAICFPKGSSLWFKSTLGLDLDQGPRAEFICAQVIETRTPVLLRDAEDDARFQGHPLAANDSQLRFYAAAPLITPDGQPIGSLCIADTRPRPGFSHAEAGRLQDLAAVVVDQLELRLERKKRERAAKAKLAFLATMSHEIRTPMNGVLGMADLILTADDLGPRHRRRIEIIQRSGEALLTLLDQILDRSKIEAEQVDLDASCFDLRELVSDIQGLFEPKAESKNLRFDSLDRLDDHHLVIGDPRHIRQILSAFLGNAIKFTEQGSITLTAAIEPGPARTVRVRFEVKDTGVGIDPFTIERVFSALEQPDQLTWSTSRGTGLGLPICKKLARMMGADIGGDSVVGEGSTFWLEIDLERQDVPEPSGQGAACPSEGEFPSMARPPSCDILVAEDEPDMALLIEDMLDEAGHRVTIACDGAAVLKALDERRFDLILMDGRMPDMSGFETTEQVRRLPDDRANIPIIALTADALTGDRERFLTAGMDDYVSKPVDYDELMQAIDRCSRKVRLQSPAPVEA